MATTVDLYVGDRGVSSLGHRRWVMNPTMAETTFGLKRSSSCMYAFSRSAPNNVEFWSWPPPGYVPTQAALGEWSFSSVIHAPGQDTVVEVAVDDGPFEPVEKQILGGNYGWGQTMSWRVSTASGSTGRAGRTVRIRLRNTRSGDFDYTVRFVDCS